MTARTTRRRRALAAAALTLAAGLAATPAPAAAGNCGGDYVACLDGRGLLDGSDRFHETECQSEYWRCVSREILIF